MIFAYVLCHVLYFAAAGGCEQVFAVGWAGDTALPLVWKLPSLHQAAPCRLRGQATGPEIPDGKQQ